jgi:hypothetical protein
MTIALLVVLLFSWPLPVEYEDPEPEETLTIDELLGPRDAGRFYQRTRYRQRIEILRKAIEDRADRLGDEIEKRNLAVVYRTLAELRGLSHHALQISLSESDERELTHREVRRLEIRLRRLVDQLEGQQLGVPLENRHQFGPTREKVEALRNQLLRQLFGSAVSDTVEVLPGRAFHSLRAAGPSHGSAVQPLLDLDKFTEEEYTKVQYAQELVKRVDVFLEIAESRLDEIDRRRQRVAEEDDGELEETEAIGEEDPLLFYTYTDLLHAYCRAVEGILTNIDERVELKTANERDIRRSLSKLADKVAEFLPRLAALEDLVTEQRDERLYRKYREALRTTEIARKGAQFGLGAVGE